MATKASRTKTIADSLWVHAEGYLETRDKGQRFTMADLKAFMQEQFPTHRTRIHIKAPIITDSVMGKGWLCWCPEQGHFAIMQGKDQVVWTGWRSLE